jgi:hypothetical protein
VKTKGIGLLCGPTLVSKSVLIRLSFPGYCVQSVFVFPWALTLDGDPYPSVALSPPEQWDALPFEGKIQILLFIGFLEWYSELSLGGYKDGGQVSETTFFQEYFLRCISVLKRFISFLWPGPLHERWKAW